MRLRTGCWGGLVVLSPAGAVERAAGERTAERAVAHLNLAVDDHVAYAGRVLMRLRVGSAVAHAGRVEDDDVGEAAGQQPPAPIEAEVVGGQAGHAPHRLL